jgi:hypothetical protein
LGIINILELINQGIILYELVNDTIVLKGLNSLDISIIYIYSIAFPLVEFISCGMLFVWCLKPTFKLGVYSILFSAANLVKSFILGIAFIIIISTSTNDSEQLGVFLVVSFVLLLILVFLQRPFLWSCRNLMN